MCLSVCGTDSANDNFHLFQGRGGAILSEGSEGKEQSFINTCLPCVLAVHRPSGFLGLSFDDGTIEFIGQLSFGHTHQIREYLQ